MMARILVVEDDEIIADGLNVALGKEGHEVLVATDGQDGLHYAKTSSPDLIILDIMMPFMNGFEVTTELRRSGENLPIIILSAREALSDKVRGLDLGADDYMTKPFKLEELLARVRRRLGGRTEATTAFGRNVYSWETQQLTDASGQPVPLTTRERRLLEFVLKRPNRIITRNQIIDGVWGDEYDGSDRTVDNFIVRLRRKIGASHILTVHGQGYRFQKK